MEKVLVLLSTYNGEKFLCQQLDSILNQKGVSVHLLIRDDGSADNTMKILETYKTKYENIDVWGGGENKGVKVSFFELMLYAGQYYPQYEYFAFSDQDDYWYSDKLSRAVNCKFKHSEKYLYHSCYEITDEKLNVKKRTTNKGINGTLGEALIRSASIGCTEVFTKAVLVNAIKFLKAQKEKNIMQYHDSAVYVTALCMKAYVVFDDYCGLKYRQHEDNVIGTGVSLLKIYKRRCKNFFKLSHYTASRADIARKVIDIDKDTYDTLSLIADYKKSLQNRFRLMFSKQYRTKNKLINLAFMFGVMIGKYK